jgi:hypothetical protein
MRLLPPPFRRRLKPALEPALELLAAGAALVALPPIALATLPPAVPATVMLVLAAADARKCVCAAAGPAPLSLGEVAAPVLLRGLELTLANPFAAPTALAAAPALPLVFVIAEGWPL